MEQKPYRGKDFQAGTTTKVVYVGTEGFQKLTKMAIEISHKGGKLISAAQLNRYLIFNCPAETIEKLLEEMKNQPLEKWHEGK